MKRDRSQHEGDIISVERHNRDFLMIDNSAVQDPNLSLKATGLLSLLISYPKDWKISLSHLCGAKADGRDSILSGLAELSQYGYLLYLRWRDSGGLWSSRYIVFETPQLKEEYLERMPEEDIEKIASPFSPSKAKAKKQKLSKETTTENPQWNDNGKTTTENPRWKNRSGEPTSDKYIDTNTDQKNKLQIKDPPTPQGESERGGDCGTLNFSQEEPKPEPEATAISPSPQTETKSTPCQPKSLDPEIKKPPAIENHSHFLPTDTTAENMEAWKAIAATGAMKGASHPDPEFLEFYRQILSKCSHYKGQNCTANHAKAALKKLWQQQPLKLLGDAENWVASKTKFTKSTQARNVKDLSDEEKAAVLQRVIDRRKQQQAAGA